MHLLVSQLLSETSHVQSPGRSKFLWTQRVQWSRWCCSWRTSTSAMTAICRSCWSSGARFRVIVCCIRKIVAWEPGYNGLHSNLIVTDGIKYKGIKAPYLTKLESKACDVYGWFKNIGCYTASGLSVSIYAWACPCINLLCSFARLRILGNQNESTKLVLNVT